MTFIYQLTNDVKASMEEAQEQAQNAANWAKQVIDAIDSEEEITPRRLRELMNGYISNVQSHSELAANEAKEITSKIEKEICNDAN